MPNDLDALLRRGVDKGAVPGVVAMATTPGATIYHGAFGDRLHRGAAPMTEDTVFFVASMMKALTATAAMQLVEQGRLHLEQEVGGFAPHLANPPVLDGFDAAGKPHLRPSRRPLTLRHLLTHTSGFAYDLWNPNRRRYSTFSGLPQTVSGKPISLEAPLLFDPGERWEYGIGIDWIGRIVEQVSGLSLDDYVDRNVYAPIGMTNSCFWPRPEHLPRLAAVWGRSPAGTLEPIDSFPVPEAPEFHPGGGGSYATAEDFLKFTRMFLNDGRADGGRVLRPETVRLMGENHIGALNVRPLISNDQTRSADVEFFPGQPAKWGLSFLLNTAFAPAGRAAGSMTWAGIANTHFWIDRTRGIGGVFFAQVMPFGDPPLMKLYNGFERGIYDRVA